MTEVYGAIELHFDFDDFVQSSLPPLHGYGDGRPDPRHRTIVCRHWLKGLCQKGDHCEYLHQMDLDKMPICKWGSSCQARPNCLYRHIDDEERPECVFYTQGFCKHGPGCRFKHIKLGAEDCPEHADFTLVQSSIDAPNTDGDKAVIGVSKSDAAPPAAAVTNFKTSICKHFKETGTCPFGEKCHFAHGVEELQARPVEKDKDGAVVEKSHVRLRQQPSASSKKHGVMGPGQLSDAEQTMLEGLLPLPADLRVRYFLVKSTNYENLAVSAAQSIWSVRRKHTPQLNSAYGSSDAVILLFSVTKSKHFQGCAVMSGDIEDVEGGGDWTPPFSVQWLRLCELPYSEVSGLTNSLYGGSQVTRSRDGDEIAADVGRLILMHMYKADQVALPQEGIPTQLRLEGAHSMDTYEYEGPQFPVPPNQPGYMFVTGGPHLDEALGKFIFGMPQYQVSEASKLIYPGMYCFLLDITGQALFGIFEIATPVLDTIDPTLFADGGRMTMFPGQVRVRCVLEVPSIPDTDPEVEDILIYQSTRRRQAPLNADQVQRLATLLAVRSGTLTGAAPYVPTPPINAIQEEPNRMMINDGWFHPQEAHMEKVYTDLDSYEGFNAAGRIVGKGGENFKRITEQSGGGVKLRIRGQGSGFAEGPSKVEAPEPMHVVVSSDNPDKVHRAAFLLREHIEVIRMQHFDGDMPLQQPHFSSINKKRGRGIPQNFDANPEGNRKKRREGLRK